MLNSITKLFSGLYRKPVTNIQKEFSKYFLGARNVEWTIGDDFDEAIFYKDDCEYIARFSKKAELIDYKINLDINKIPSKLKSEVDLHGELMNAIAIYQNGKIFGYEIIFRDKDLKRFSMSASSNYNIQNIEAL